MRSHIHLGLGQLLGRHWTVRSRRIPLSGVGKAHSEVPVELLGAAGSGVWACTEAEIGRFLLLGTADASECRRRAENGVGAGRLTLAWSRREKGRMRARAGSCREENHWLTQAWFGGSHVWECREAFPGRLDTQLFRGRPAPLFPMAVQMRRGSPSF